MKTTCWLALIVSVASQRIAATQSLSSSSAAGSGSSASSPNETPTVSLSCEGLGQYGVAVLGKKGLFCVAQQPCSGTQSQITHFACPDAGQRSLTGESTLTSGSCCAVLSTSGVIGCASLDNKVQPPQCLTSPDWYTPVTFIPSASPSPSTTPASPSPVPVTPRVTRELEPTPTPPQTSTNRTATPTRTPSPGVTPEPEAGDPPESTSHVPTPIPVTPEPTPTPTPAPSPSVHSPSPSPHQGSQSSDSSSTGGDVGDGSHTAGSTEVSADADDRSSDAGFPTDPPMPTQDPAALKHEDETRNDFATMKPIYEDTPNPTASRLSDTPAATTTVTAQPSASSTTIIAGSVNDNTLVFIVVGAIVSVAVVVGAVILRGKRPQRSDSLRGLEAATPITGVPRADGRYDASNTPRDSLELM